LKIGFFLFSEKFPGCGKTFWKMRIEIVVLTTICVEPGVAVEGGLGTETNKGGVAFL
jgi:hypothetical protein